MSRAPEKFSKKMNNFKKRLVTPAFYVMKWKWQAYSTLDQLLVLRKSYLECILAEPEEGCQSRYKSAIATILLLKTYQIWFLCHLLPSSFKIFINVFAFCM